MEARFSGEIMVLGRVFLWEEDATEIPVFVHGEDWSNQPHLFAFTLPPFQERMELGSVLTPYGFARVGMVALGESFLNWIIMVGFWIFDFGLRKWNLASRRLARWQPGG